MIQRLPNGLTAVLVENRSAPVVALQIWVKVGSADEREDEAGLAHLHEHMLFKGTESRPPGQIAYDVESRGGEINAWTSFDQTVYHLVIAAPFWAHGLDILADSVRHSSFDPEELRRETQVVVEEIKRSEDTPARRVSRELFSLAYQVHPYRNPVIGSAESVLGFQRSQILNFYRRHYVPGNMVLVVVGDFDEQRGLAEIERCFGDWQAPAEASNARPKEPTQGALRAQVIADGVQEAYLTVAFHIPGLIHPDVPALDLLGVLLGQGESSRLNVKLRRREQLMTEVYAYGYTPRDPGLWVAGGTATHGREAHALRGLLSELQHTREERFSVDDLAKAKNLLQAEQIYQHETVQGWARKLGFYETMAGSLEAEAEYQAQVQATTADEVREAAQRYFRMPNLSIAALLPSASDEAPQSLTNSEAMDIAARTFRSLTPPPIERLPATISRAIGTVASSLASTERHPVQSFELPHGGRLLIKRETAVPLCAFRAAYAGGLRLENETDNGVTALLGRVLTEGADDRSAETIARDVDRMAGSLSAVPGRNSFGLRGEFLSQYFEEALPLFLSCLLRPSLPEAEVTRERYQQIQEIRTRADHPSSLVFDLFHQTLYRTHPYRFNLGGELASVERLDADLLRDRWSRYYPVSRLQLAVAGDVRAERVLELVSEALRREPSSADLSSAPVAAEARPREPRFARRELTKAQSHVVLGFLGTTVTSPDRYALQILSSVLSGQGGRLFVELRDRRSLAYSLSGFSTEGLDPGYFAIYVGTSPDKVDQVLAGVREQLERLRQERVPAEEFGRAQRYLIGSHAIGLQRRGSIAGAMALDQAYGLPADNYLHHTKWIEGVTAEQLLTTAQRYFEPRGEVVAVVGPSDV